MRLEYKPGGETPDEKNTDGEEFDASKIMPGGAESLMQETRFQWNRMKEKSFKEKLSYFFYYYKVHVLVVIAAVFVLVSLIRTFTSHKDYAFYAMMINSGYINATALSEAFSVYADIDIDTYDCYIDTSATLSASGLGTEDVSTSTKVAASVQAGELDVVVIDAENFEVYALNGIVADLRSIFTEEELASYEGSIYYVDQAKVDEYNNTDYEVALSDSTTKSAADVAAALFAHKNPDGMTEPVPVGIVVGDAPFITETGAYPTYVPVYGIVANTSHTTECRAFLSYLFDPASITDEVLTYGF